MSTFDDLKQDLDKVLDEIDQSPVWLDALKDAEKAYRDGKEPEKKYKRLYRFRHQIFNLRARLGDDEITALIKGLES